MTEGAVELRAWMRNRQKGHSGTLNVSGSSAVLLFCVSATEEMDQ